jgi:thiamine-monophosphate kinase
VADCGERALIARIRDRLVTPPWVVIGPGDDAAVVEPIRGALEVWTTDALVDGVHFDRRFVPPAAIGHRALAANLSDLAAMGARPRAALLALALPGTLELDAFDGLIEGMLALARRHGVSLVGGNITSTPGPLTIDVTAVGSVHRRRILTRAGARPGDDLFVTGSLGEAAAGLETLRRDPSAPAQGPVARYLRPEPRVRAGVQLGAARVATSCIDLSDGLADGLRRIAEASSVGMVLDGDAVPVLRDSAGAPWTDALDRALRAGDDYELLFTVRRTHGRRLRALAGQLGDLPITRIGVVTRARELLVSHGPDTRPLPDGHEHFR